METTGLWIVIHPNVDLDACACVELSGVLLDDTMPVHFWPANLKEKPTVCPCCERPVPTDLGIRVRILDHPLGQKGRRDNDGRVHAAACSMPEALLADPALMAEIDQQDREGKVEGGGLQLARLLHATRAYGTRELGLQGRALDLHVVRIMAGLLRGLNMQYCDMQYAQQIAAGMMVRGEMVEIGNFKVALLPAEQVPALGIVLERAHGVDCAIYADGHNLGVTRYPGHHLPDLRQLGRFLPDWFVHTHGFIASWGTLKAPRHEPPPAGTPQNARELLALMERVFVYSP